ncbi:MAG: FHA domain-containing protein [Verrucomicrobia bacterium]|nr:FHA domain-containing protein [Verrucomicrobiota bacterium]
MSEKLAVISYRRKDSTDITGRIYDRLIANFGKKAVFKDVGSIPLGVHFAEHISATIKRSRVVIAVIGSEWWGSSDDTSCSRRLDDPKDFVRIEIESAIENNIPIIPLLVKGMHMPNETELPDSLKRLAFYNGIPVRIDPDFHRDMDTLIAGLEQMGFQRLSKNPDDERSNLPDEISAYLLHSEKTIPILQTPFTVGRHISNSLTLASNNVSKRHARITFLDNNFYLEDLDSTNGTYLILGQEETQLEANKRFILNVRTCFRLGKKKDSPLLTFEFGGQDLTFLECTGF